LTAKGRWPANLLLDEDAAEMLGQQSGELGKSSGGRLHSGTTGNTGIYGRDKRVEVGDPGFGDTGTAARFFYTAKASRKERNAGLEGMEARELEHQYGDTMSRGRNPETGQRTGHYNKMVKNNHPTVKPLDLMRYLCKLTKTPTGGIVLDPFMGSGTTGMAAIMEGREFIGIELDADYYEIARRRIEWAKEQQPELQLALL